MTAPNCTCPCRGCVAFHAHAAPHLSINEEELALALTLAVSDSLRGRGIDPTEPGGDAKAVELVLTRATAIARQLGQLIEEPQNSGLLESAQASLEFLAANLTSVLGGRPRLS